MKKISYCGWLNFIFLFAFVFLFSITSLALIPGDFGSAGGGPPDGVVDFEDLMIFALAYGSTPADANWNPLCDIYPDDKIDFEDLMIFAMNYGKREAVTGLHATAKTYEYEGNIEYQIELRWNSYPEASDYHVYRRIDQGIFSEIQGEIYEDDDEMEFRDENLDGVSTYSYYVTADTTAGETSPSLIVTIDTFLPPCYCTTPSHESVVTNPTPTLEWINMDIDNFPYGPLYFADNNIRVEDESTGEEVWEFKIADFNVSSAVYNQDGEAVPLIPGHIYEFSICADCEDESGDEIANSVSWSRFYYGYQPWVVICRTETITPNPYFMPPPVRILWTDYTNANDYQVYKSTDGNNFTLLEGEYELLEYEWLGRGYWYDFWDHETIKGNTYYYYVKAFDGATELQTSSTMTVDTWLPGIIAIDPIEDEVVTDPTPTFMWQYENSISFPYGPFDFSRAFIGLNDTESWDFVWEIELNNLDIFSYTYDGPSLIEGRRYVWYRVVDGEGDGISTSTASMGFFFYVEPL